jgi:Tellurite resistance protein TerB.
MNSTPDSIVFAVQSAVLELLELIEGIAQDGEPAKREAFSQEAQKTVLMFIAAIVLSNREYTPTNPSFLSILVDCKDLPGGEVRYLNEYATRWVEASNQIPHFLEAAVQYDSIHKTGIARAMLRHIQTIGNHVCASDGKISGAERETVQQYLTFLEEFMNTSRCPTTSENDTSMGLLSSVPPVECYLEPEVQPDRFVSVTVPPASRKAELRWIPANESVQIQGYQIPSGMIYVSDGETAIAEASTINTRLPIGQAGRAINTRLNYYPQYVWLSPDQRAAYLEWIAAGRKDANPESRELGYVFLFFYGLERRLLVEKAQEQEVVAEIVRLLHHYGPYTRSRSLQSYTSQLIHFWGWQQGVEYYEQLLEWMKSLPVSLLGADELSIVLASYFQRNKQLIPELAYELASRNFEARRSVVVSRVNTEFRSLFSKRYLEHFPSGLSLSQSKRSARLHYRPASPTLLYGRGDFSIQIPDVMGLPSQFKPLTAIWNSCVDDLAGYSRAKGKAGDVSAKLKAHMALPAELRADSSHPLTKLWEEILVGARPGKDCSIVAVGNVTQLLAIPQREKLTHGQSRILAETIESLGFEVEPDARHDAAYAWDQELAVYKPTGEKFTAPSQKYRGASLFLKLCVLVAGADGCVAPEEIKVSRHFIEKNLTLSPEDHRRLDALEQVLVADPSRIRGSLARIARPMLREQRELICEVLVYVAAADNVVTKDEIRSLKRIFKAFELSPDRLEAHLKTITTEFREVTIQSKGDRIPGEVIPRPSQPFHINMSRVDQIAQETSEIIGILSKVMVDEDLENEQDAGSGKKIVMDDTRVLLAANKGVQTATIPEWIKSLDSKYHPILLRLIERASWTRTDFDKLVKGFQLMPLNVFDAINEWSDECLGDFLLEGEDPIVVHKDSIP